MGDNHRRDRLGEARYYEHLKAPCYACRYFSGNFQGERHFGTESLAATGSPTIYWVFGSNLMEWQSCRKRRLPSLDALLV